MMEMPLPAPSAPARVSPGSVRHLVETLYPVKVMSLTQLDGYVDLNFRLDVEVDGERAGPSWGTSRRTTVVFKVVNPRDSATAHPAAEEQAAGLLRECGVPFPRYLTDRNNRTRSLQLILNDDDMTEEGRLHSVCMLTFLPGLIMSEVKVTARLLHQCGDLMGRVDMALKVMRREDCVYDSAFEMTWIPHLRQLAQCLLAGEDDNLLLADDILTLYQTEVADRWQHFQKGVIHGDLHPPNLLVERKKHDQWVTGSDNVEQTYYKARNTRQECDTNKGYDADKESDFNEEHVGICKHGGSDDRDADKKCDINDELSVNKDCDTDERCDTVKEYNVDDKRVAKKGHGIDKECDNENEHDTYQERNIDIECDSDKEQDTTKESETDKECDTNKKCNVDNDVQHYEEKEFMVTGLLDLGDMQHALYVHEVSTTIASLILAVDPRALNLPLLAVAGHLLAGYLQHVQLAEHEMRALRVCVAARRVQVLLLGRRTLQEDPDNDYVRKLCCDTSSWQRLRQFWEIPCDILRDSWSDVIASYTSAGMQGHPV